MPANTIEPDVIPGPTWLPAQCDHLLLADGTTEVVYRNAEGLCVSIHFKESGFASDLGINEFIFDLMRSEDVGPLMSRAREAQRDIEAVRVIYQFLQDPKGYGSPLWTQQDLRDHYLPLYKRLLEIAIPELYPELQPLVDQFDLYWMCEHKEAGYIYCLHDQQGHYKLGRSKYLDKRIKQLSTLPPFDIELIHSLQVLFADKYESALHEHFASQRLRGEWFRLSAEDIESIRSESWARPEGY